MAPDGAHPVAADTVDPDRDTPTALADQLSSIDPRICGLTKTAAETSAIAAAYHDYTSGAERRRRPSDGSHRDGYF
jgi:cytochrome oxidase Cu insertion factor (SCO1/SenC/PrrC family)